MKPRMLLHRYAVTRGTYMGKLIKLLLRLKPRREHHQGTVNFGANDATWLEKQRHMENWTPDAEEYRAFYSDFLRYCFHYTGFKPVYLLDVGCGNYFWQTFRKYLRCFYVGVDPSVKLTTGVDFIVTPERAEHVEYPSGFFDVVWLISVLDHVEDEHRVMDEAERLLKVGGVLWVTATVFKDSAHVDGNYAREHMRFFTRGTLLTLISSYFRVLKVFRRPDNVLYVMAKKKEVK
jgi:SAM-dependent methyltransferase